MVWKFKLTLQSNIIIVDDNRLERRKVCKFTLSSVVDWVQEICNIIESSNEQVILKDPVTTITFDWTARLYSWHEIFYGSNIKFIWHREPN